MAHQRSRRLGWQSQNVARFLLYKLAFVAEPVQIGDDIGVDYFCTLFDEQPNKTNANLIPRNSFAIQIKSKNRSNKIDLTKHIDYLKNLELPYFIGIVDRKALKLTIYSGEALTPFFIDTTSPQHLEAELYERSLIEGLFSWRKTEPNYTLPFPKVTEITANMSDEELRMSRDEIHLSCVKMLDNIASINNKQFLLRGVASNDLLIFANPISVQFFEINFIKRLTEVFFNLHALHSYEQYRSSVKEKFQLYETIYRLLLPKFGHDELFGLLQATFDGAKKEIDGKETQIVDSEQI